MIWQQRERLVLQRLNSELESVLREARLCHTTSLICPSVPHELRNEEGYRQFRNQLNAIAKKEQQGGFTLSFHNHAFEV